MWSLQIPQKLVYENFYVHEIAAVDLSQIYFLKNEKKICEPNNRDLNRNWISVIVVILLTIIRHLKRCYFKVHIW